MVGGLRFYNIFSIYYLSIKGEIIYDFRVEDSSTDNQSHPVK